ncbi:MAG: hypothetical protein R6W82_00550 [bacterium]
MTFPTAAGPALVPERPEVVSAVLNDARVQDCLWIALMEWDLRIQDVVLRPRPAAEGGILPDGWVLCVGLGPGVRLEASCSRGGSMVHEVRLLVRPGSAPALLRRTWHRRPGGPSRESGAEGMQPAG